MADVDKGAYTNPFEDGETRVYDIVNDYDWTTAPAGSKLRSQTPNAYVTAYKMEFSQLQQFIDGYINIASSSARAEKLGNNPGLQFYKDMYSSGSVLADINFPFFDDNIRGFTSEYENTFSPISERAGTFLFGDRIEKLGGAAENLIGGTIAGGRELGNLGGNAMAEKVAGGVGAFGQMAGGAFEKLTGKKLPGLQTVGAPGSYIETPKFYQYSNTDEGINIEFVLSNTLNDYRGNKGFKQNLKFIKEFTMMNRPYRYGPIEMTFPAIYHLEIPGLRYIEWAYLENFGVKLIGARRRIGKNIIPEAYGFNFQFKSLTIEAANFVQMTDRVEGFDEGDANYRALRKEADKDSAAREAQKKKELKEQQERLEAAKAAEDKRKAEEEAKRKAEEEKLRLEDEIGNGEDSEFISPGIESQAEIDRKLAEMSDKERRDAEEGIWYDTIDGKQVRVPRKLTEEQRAEINNSSAAQNYQSDAAREARLKKARELYTESAEAAQAQKEYDEVKDLTYLSKPVQERIGVDMPEGLTGAEQLDYLQDIQHERAMSLVREQDEAQAAQARALADPLSQTDLRALAEQNKLTDEEAFAVRNPDAIDDGIGGFVTMDRREESVFESSGYNIIEAEDFADYKQWTENQGVPAGSANRYGGPTRSEGALNIDRATGEVNLTHLTPGARAVFEERQRQENIQSHEAALEEAAALHAATYGEDSGPDLSNEVPEFLRRPDPEQPNPVEQRELKNLKD